MKQATTTAALIGEAALSLRREATLNNIIEAVGNASIVMIGECSHGTDECYAIRAEITKRLIEQKGFNNVCVEADFPDAYRINRFVCGSGKLSNIDKTAEEALGDFERFPKWMWRNERVLEFVKWLREHNETENQLVGFYGLDLYSFFKSCDAVIQYLDEVSPEDAEVARKRYEVLHSIRRFDASNYASLIMSGMIKSQEHNVVSMLQLMLKNGPQFLKARGFLNGDELFYATENAELVCDAEEYYRHTYAGSVHTWNLRDSHMAKTVEHLQNHWQQTTGEEPKFVVWAHNSHLGDARATDWVKHGEINVGQLLRETHGLDNTFSIGFSTYTGTVTAATKWDAEPIKFEVNRGIDDSYEKLFHSVVGEIGSDFALVMRSNNTSGVAPVNPEVMDILKKQRYQRHIGVIYSPKTEFHSHYIKARLPDQFDVCIHVDVSNAVVPLDPLINPMQGKKEKLALRE